MATRSSRRARGTRLLEPAAHGLRGLLADREALRRRLVLAELLGPPLADAAPDPAARLRAAQDGQP